MWKTFYFLVFSCVFYYLWKTLLCIFFCSMLSMQYALADFYDKLLINFYHTGFWCADMGPACTKLLTIIWWPFHHPIGYMLPNIHPIVEPVFMWLTKYAPEISNGGTFSFLLPINHKFISCITVQPFRYCQVEVNGFSFPWGYPMVNVQL